MLNKQIAKVKVYVKEHKEEIIDGAKTIVVGGIIGVSVGLAIDNYKLRKAINNTIDVVKDVSLKVMEEGKILDASLDLLKSEGKENSDEYREELFKATYLLGLMNGVKNTTLVLVGRQDMIE